MLRQEIIEKLDKKEFKYKRDSNINLLSDCLLSPDETKHVKLETWLRGCIESLFYRPNKYCLTLVGKQGIGKSSFISGLFPQKKWWLNSPFIKSAQKNCYDFFAIDLGECLTHYSKVKQMRSMCLSEEFVVIDEEWPVCDKRLASYCATVQEWSYPKSKWDLIIEIDGIDLGLFSTIDKNQLWIEIFNKFKPVK